MSDFRSRLPEHLRPDYDAAVLRAGQLLAAAYAERDEQEQREQREPQAA